MRRVVCAAALVLLVFTLVAGSASARSLAVQKRRQAKPLFDLPVGYYLAAGAICVGIGAAGGVAYAGIMGPKRTPKEERASSENP